MQKIRWQSQREPMYKLMRGSCKLLPFLASVSGRRARSTGRAVIVRWRCGGIEGFYYALRVLQKLASCDSLGSHGRTAVRPVRILVQ